MRRLSAARRVALGLVVAAGAVAVWPGHGADALAPRKVGYWVQAQSGSLPTPLPTPPVVPAGGLYVANGPDGPKAVSAIAYEVEPDVSGLLVLHVHSMATGLPPSPLAGTPAQPPAPDPVLAHLSACVVQGDWAAPDGAGVWEARPAFDPAQCVIGQFSTDGATVTFPLGAERQAGPGEFNLTIVPNPALTGTDNTPFSVTFEPPLEESMMPGEAAGSDSGEEPVF
ncbi:MAG: hypothetical protein QOI20_2823, partial [Acidimicrobiaceae bacterium]|nr:hypothetical protein [Acidimicrobiaceae bacterium]